MQEALKRFFKSAFHVVFDPITDRSMITSMNSVLNRWAMDGYRFYDYIDNGTLYTKKINQDVNDYTMTITKNGKKKWIIPYKYFAKEIKSRFPEGIYRKKIREHKNIRKRDHWINQWSCFLFM